MTRAFAAREPCNCGNLSRALLVDRKPPASRIRWSWEDSGAPQARWRWVSSGRQTRCRPRTGRGALRRSECAGRESGGTGEIQAPATAGWGTRSAGLGGSATPPAWTGLSAGALNRLFPGRIPEQHEVLAQHAHLQGLVGEFLAAASDVPEVDVRGVGS